DDRLFVGVSESPEGVKSQVKIRHHKHTSGDSVHIDKEGRGGYYLSVYQNSFARDPEDEFRISSDFVVPADLLETLEKLKPDSVAHAKLREDRSGSAAARAIGARTELKGTAPYTVLSTLFPLHSKRKF
ncbi:MAG: hypothetical protein K2X64_02860, partial [Rhodocyclaceae bacterium]|nr:hypothetical protein [Rhodocyclaceae bacterium]